MRFFIFYFFINSFIYLFFWLHWVSVAARRLVPSCGERGLLFVEAQASHWVASLVAEHGF